MSNRPTSSKRDALLDAARRIVARDGASKLTLDHVAREAGVSKGGLLHHFPSKDALIRGMIDDDLGRVQARMERHADGRPGAFLRAYVRDTLPAPDAVSSQQAVEGALLAAVAENPALLEPLRDVTRQWQHKAEADGLDPVLASIVRMAADGLYFNELFDLGRPTGDLRERFLARLLDMAAPEGEDAP